MRQTENGIVRAPTDLSNFLSCRHLSTLDLQVAQGVLERPVRFNPVLDDLQARGIAHEKAYLEHLQAEGLTIAGVESREGDESVHTPRDSFAAMREGVDVVYQARLEDGDWSGRIDFLRRVGVSSNLGDWSYEPVDTKLARETRAGTILQLCVYAHLLERVQGVRPASMHVVTPGNGFEPISYRTDDYAAYFRLLEQNIAQFLDGSNETYPEKVSHCDYCGWWSQCEKRRRDDDHLCYVAGISKSQINSLATLGIERLAELAALHPVPKPSRGSREALQRAQDQARIQVLGRDKAEPVYELKKPFDVNHGLALLPKPTPDDIFLDFEGNRFEEEGVREYLLGYVAQGQEGEFAYAAHWATSRNDERAAFEHFMDFASEVKERNPGAHIYHFAPYEPVALKRLMGRYATREVELDKLLRAGAFVDLHKVIKRTLVASVESYSIKELEPFFGYSRAQDLREASRSRRIVEQAVSAGDLGEDLAPHRRIVEDYNREDCESTVRLRDWLERRRAELLSNGEEIPRPVVKGGEASEAIGALDSELQELRDSLLNGVPLEPGERSPEEQARFVLAHMMEFHRREDKAAWWEYFRVRGLGDDELEEERRALTGLNLQEPLDDRSAPLQRYGFPAQEVDARKKDNVFDRDGNKVGTVYATSYIERTIDIKKTARTADYHPAEVLFHSRIPSKPLLKSLMRFGEAVLDRGFSQGDPYRVGMELLLRKSPPLEKNEYSLQRPAESTVEAACRIALSLDGNVLAIQGPPGTGKTYTGAHVICALVRAGLKVGVTAVSHKVIVNLLEGAAEQALSSQKQMEIVHRQDGEYEGEFGIRRESKYELICPALKNGDIDVLGATAWCWSRPDFEQSVDVLIVDEAGQMSLANTLAVAPAGRSMVLLGDPQQLEQPLQSSHPEGSEVSALNHLLDGQQTMPADKGLFLADTYRLHPDIAKFTSEIYYEGKLGARPGLGQQAIIPNGGSVSEVTGSGLLYVPVNHAANQARAPEEIEIIQGLVDELMGQCSYRNKDGDVTRLTVRDILIMAPYNVQVSALIEALPALAGRIGTVDRFQGQEAPVVIYSMTSSTPEYAPRGMEFLYDPFRFNVATSRARALCILVGCQDLFRPDCRTPRQMKLANGFCRFLELARVAECHDNADTRTVMSVIPEPELTNAP